MRTVRAIILILHVTAALAGADVVFLNNGKSYEGRVTYKGERIIIDVEYGQLEFMADEVREVVKAKLPDKPAPTSTAPPPAESGARATYSAVDVTRPEPVVFLFMRRLSAAKPGRDSFEARSQIDRWRSASHDRLRRIGAQWYGPKEFQARRAAFESNLVAARETARKLKRVRGDKPAERKKRKKLRVALGGELLTAAQKWADPALRNFLVGAAQYEGGRYHKAEGSFRKCRRQIPMVAAFHQGHGLALVKVGRPLEAMEAFARALQLRPGSRDALKLLRDGMQAVPGTRTEEDVFQRAKKLDSRYEASSGGSSSSRKRMRWLLPGKVEHARDGTLPVPQYDRLTVRQAPGVAVGKHALLVDAAAVTGASEVLVRIDGNTLTPAKLGRRRSSRKGVALPPLAVVMVSDYEFTPAGFSPEATLPAGQTAAIHRLGIFAEMGSVIDVVHAEAAASPDSDATGLSAGLRPGDAASPVLTADGQLVGFLAGRTDPAERSGGPDKLYGSAALAPLVKRAAKSSPRRSYSGSAKRTGPSAPAGGRIFIVYAIECETLH